MDLPRFKDQLATLGPNLARWPAAERDAAVDLLAASTAAQDLLATASADALPDPRAPDVEGADLVARLVAGLPPRA